jgi:hypothetical protein
LTRASVPAGNKFLENLFATAPGATIRGWLNDFVPLMGVSYVF